MFKTTTSIVALVAAGAIFFMYTQPTYDKVKDSAVQIAQYDEALTKANELLKLRDTLLEQRKKFRDEDITRLEKLLPDHVDNVRLILDIDSLAGKHGMAIQNVVVSSSQTAKSSQTAIGTVSSSKQKYDSLTIKFNTQGTYENFRTLLDDMQKSLRVVDLVSLSIAPAGAGTPTGPNSAPLYNFEIALRTYWLK